MVSKVWVGTYCGYLRILKCTNENSKSDAGLLHLVNVYVTGMLWMCEAEEKFLACARQQSRV